MSPIRKHVPVLEVKQTLAQLKYVIDHWYDYDARSMKDIIGCIDTLYKFVQDSGNTLARCPDEILTQYQKDTGYTLAMLMALVYRENG